MVDGRQSIAFCTFGMFIIDEIEWKIENPPATQYDLIGGAGTYSALGARLAVSPLYSLSPSVSWIVDMGSDFPNQLKVTIDRWNTTCHFRQDLHRLTTRAWNGYGANGWRDFKYCTPKKRLEVSSLLPDQVMSKSFHMVCSPERCMDLTQRLQQKRAEIRASEPWPVIIWEPIPDLCSPEELQRLHMAARNCSIVSPNHDELKLFFEDARNKTQVELVENLMGWSCTESHGSAHTHVIPIIREGSRGSTAYFRIGTTAKKLQSGSLVEELCTVSIHLSAYHDSSMAGFVIDPTGGGNTYLGALAISLTDVHAQASHPSLTCICAHLGWSMEGQETRSNGINPDQGTHSSTFSRIRAVVVAMLIANIAASFAIEQNGVPDLTEPSEQKGKDELWNSETFLFRLNGYLERETSSIRAQIKHVTTLLG